MRNARTASGFAAALITAWLAGPTPGAANDAAVLAPAGGFSKPERHEALPGGAATSRKPLDADAFSHNSANMSFERQLDFKIGNGIFKKLWVSAPASTRSSDGLGPLYNARSCRRCHLKDGRGHPPVANWPGDNAVSMLFRLSIPPRGGGGGGGDRAALAEGKVNGIADPVYGSQLQDFSVQGLLAEGRIAIDYEERPVTLGDGTRVSLRKPIYRIEGLNHGPLHPRARISPRVAPPMIGLGLLESLDDAAILAHADPDDRDGDGISGRANRVWDHERGAPALGRFGWKAGQPTLRQQVASAFSHDMGLSTAIFPAVGGDCSDAQTDCRAAPDGAEDGHEVSDEMFGLVLFYSRNLAVPRRRDLDHPEVLAGKRLFYEAGCIACHVPKHITRRDDTQPEQSRQLIWPYTDLLLHDMGEGLADGAWEGRANGREWRTPPLWGIGLTEVVNGHTLFLHDGRARNLLEAILWHGGEAEPARQAVAAMNRAERAQLLRFLNSL